MRDAIAVAAVVRHRTVHLLHQRPHDLSGLRIVPLQVAAPHQSVGDENLGALHVVLARRSRPQRFAIRKALRRHGFMNGAKDRCRRSALTSDGCWRKMSAGRRPAFSVVSQWTVCWQLFGRLGLDHNGFRPEHIPSRTVETSQPARAVIDHAATFHRERASGVFVSNRAAPQDVRPSQDQWHKAQQHSPPPPLSEACRAFL